MKFIKGQNVTYIPASGNSYSATVIDIKKEFDPCVVKRNTTLYYVIQLLDCQLNQPILCAEKNLEVIPEKYHRQGQPSKKLNFNRRRYRSIP